MINKRHVGKCFETSIQSPWLNNRGDKHKVKWVTISAIREFGLVQDGDRQTPHMMQPLVL